MIVLPLNLILDLQQESEYGKIQGEPLDVIFGNGWGRNFFFKTFVEQTNHSPNDYEKVASDSIVKVPLQTVHEPEVIWNDNSDKQDERLR